MLSDVVLVRKRAVLAVMRLRKRLRVQALAVAASAANPRLEHGAVRGGTQRVVAVVCYRSVVVREGAGIADLSGRVRGRAFVVVVAEDLLDGLHIR